MIDPATFKSGMRRLASGVSLVTTVRDGQPHGLLATSVSSVSAEPQPCLLVCINRSASAYDHIRDSGVFCINLLADGDQAVADRFTSSTREGRFQDVAWTALATGAPALRGALASFDCEITTTLDVNSHTIFVGTVLALRLSEDIASPLLYFDGGFHVVPHSARVEG